MSSSNDRDRHFLAKRKMPDGRLAVVIALTYDRGRITIGDAHGFTYDDSW
jgi:hypothetical protein